MGEASRPLRPLAFDGSSAGASTGCVHRPVDELHGCDSSTVAPTPRRRSRSGTCRDGSLRGRCPAGRRRRAGRRRAGPPGGELAAASRSSCWRAAICWANSVAWMPWNRPSSQPTSWAWAIRSSASVGVLASPKGRRQPGQLVRRSGDSAVGQLRDRRLVDLPQAVAAGARRAAAWRTSSSSCLIIEPIRMTLAGWSTDSRLGRRSVATTWRLREDRRPLGRSAPGVGVSDMRPSPSGLARSPTTPGEQGHEHLGRGQRAVAADERDTGRCRRGRRRRRRSRATRATSPSRPAAASVTIGPEPALGDDLLAGAHPGPVAVARRRRPRAARRPRPGGRAASGTGPRPTGARRGAATSGASGAITSSPTSTWPWSAVTTSAAPGGQRPSSRSATRRSAARQLGVVVRAEAVLVGDLVDAVVVGVDERLAGRERAGATSVTSVDGIRQPREADAGEVGAR